jgi:hypothetical protein
MERDEEIQEALDREQGHATGDADEAAYRVVFAALGEDEGFALPPHFADAMTARLMPAPVRASPFERYVLPVLMAAAFVIGIPFVIAVMGGALGEVAEPGSRSGLQGLAAVAMVLLVVALADRQARRAGLAPV